MVTVMKFKKFSVTYILREISSKIILKALKCVQVDSFEAKLSRLT